MASPNKSTYYNNSYRITNGSLSHGEIANWGQASSGRLEFNNLGSASYTWVPRETSSDTAWMVGYKVAYGYSAGIQTENNGAATPGAGDNWFKGTNELYRNEWLNDQSSWGYNPDDHNNYQSFNTDVKYVYDYGDGAADNTTDANLAPTRAVYEVRFQNRADEGNTTDKRRAAHLSTISLTSTFDENLGTTDAQKARKAFRLQNVYVPAYLVGNRSEEHTSEL